MIKFYVKPCVRGLVAFFFFILDSTQTKYYSPQINEKIKLQSADYTLIFSFFVLTPKKLRHKKLIVTILPSMAIISKGVTFKKCHF